MAGIGHNRGPGTGWRRHCWTRARAELLNNKLPLQIIRARVRRAEELGLTYPQYASALMGSGRDIVGFLFTCDALGLRLRRRLEMPGEVQAKLCGVTATLTAFSPEGEPAGPFRAELSHVAGIDFAAAGPAPQDASWQAARQAVGTILAPLKLPGKAMILVGTREAEAGWMAAAGMAKYLDRESYFGAA